MTKNTGPWSNFCAIMIFFEISVVFSGCCKRFPCFLLALALTVIQCEESRQTNQRVHAIRGTGNMLVWEGFGVWKCLKEFITNI